MRRENDPYVIWGSAGHAKVLAELIALLGGRVVALFDNDLNAKSALEGTPLYIGQEGFFRWVAESGKRDGLCGIAAIGGSRGRDRIQVHDFFLKYGMRVPVLIHPKAWVSPSARLAEGSQVLAQAVVAAGARIGRAAIINHHANVDHECILGDGVHIAPGATLCGCITVGDYVMIGAGATVMPRLTIGVNSIVGAGAVVTRDVPSNVLVAGNPAQIIRDNTLSS